MPDETVRVARAIFPDGNLYMQWYDTFGVLFADEDFIALFAQDGQPGLSPVRLSLVLILQYAEGLSARQAADAVRTRSGSDSIIISFVRTVHCASQCRACGVNTASERLRWPQD